MLLQSQTGCLNFFFFFHFQGCYDFLVHFNILEQVDVILSSRNHTQFLFVLPNMILCQYQGSHTRNWELLSLNLQKLFGFSRELPLVYIYIYIYDKMKIDNREHIIFHEFLLLGARPTESCCILYYLQLANLPHAA